jgi:hypothetical protein
MAGRSYRSCPTVNKCAGIADRPLQNVISPQDQRNKLQYMTDFAPASSLSEFPESTAPTFWAAAAHGSRVANDPAGPAPGASAASLAASVQELLATVVARRVPRIDAVRDKLQAVRPLREMAEVVQALKALYAGAAQLDFLHAREGGERTAAFLQQARVASADIQRLWVAGAAYFQRHGTGDAQRTLDGALEQESRALDRRVRQGLQWLGAMEADLAVRRAASTAEVALRALDELERRGHLLRQRLEVVEDLAHHTRGALAAAAELVAGHAVFAETLQARVAPATRRLHAGLQALLQEGAGALEAAQLLPLVEAAHELQVGLTQAGADVQRLHAADQVLAAHLVHM